MVDRLSLSFEIENKRDIESIISSSCNIPINELHIKKGTDLARKLESVDSTVSVALVAKADRKLGCPGYTIGYIEKAKVVFNNIQEKPLIINHGMVQRALKEFTDNSAYHAYELEVISPSIGLSEFFRSRGALAPYATPHRAYRG